MLLSEKGSDHFKEYGYAIISSNLNKEHIIFEKKLVEYFNKSFAEYNIASKLDSISNYHDYVNMNNIDHHSFIQKITRKLPQEFIEDKFVKEIIKECASFFNCKLNITDNIVWFRLCRSQSDDSNDLHRDHWFPNYSDVINLYVPISGSYADSAMKVVPKSHKWSDEDVIPTFSGDSGQKYIKNGVKYSAPGIKYSKHEIVTHRPDVKTGDFMLFNPKAVHGGGDNFSDYTRVSLEIRVEKA